MRTDAQENLGVCPGLAQRVVLKIHGKCCRQNFILLQRLQVDVGVTSVGATLFAGWSSCN